MRGSASTQRALCYVIRQFRRQRNGLSHFLIYNWFWLISQNICWGRLWSGISTGRAHKKKKSFFGDTILPLDTGLKPLLHQISVKGDHVGKLVVCTHRGSLPIPSIPGLLQHGWFLLEFWDWFYFLSLDTVTTEHISFVFLIYAKRACLAFSC